MKILFICLSSLKFNVHTPYSEPLGGTESAMSYLAVALVKEGHDVTLMRNDPEESVIDGVKHLPISEDIAPMDPDVVIVASAPQAFPAIKKIVSRAKLILWNHMRPDQPVMAHFFQGEVAKAIDQVVYVSEVQRKAFEDTYIDKATMPTGCIIGNAIAPCFENMFASAEEIQNTKQCRGVYTSTPFRGLAILAHIKELPIDVYSSMKVYQGDDTPFLTMYESLKANDCIDMKGSVSQTELRDHLREVSFLVYPSIFAECHSIAILEAMAAGLKVITTDVASPQTEYIDSMSATDGSLDAYALLLRKNINAFRAHNQEWSQKMFKQVQHVNKEFTWAKRANEWSAYLTSLCC